MKTRRVVAAALLPLIGACRSMQPVPVDFIPQTNPAVVYLSDGYGVTQAVANPRLSGDTVHGTTVGGNQPVAVPLNRVQRMSTVRLNPARTAFLVGGLTAVGALMTYAMLARAHGDGADYCDYDRQPTGPGAVECAYPSNP
jgi:hypothetical protein